MSEDRSDEIIRRNKERTEEVVLTGEERTDEVIRAGAERTDEIIRKNEERTDEIIRNELDRAHGNHSDAPTGSVRWDRILIGFGVFLAGLAFLVTMITIGVRISQLDDRLVRASFEQETQTRIIENLQEQIEEQSVQLDSQRQQINRLETQVRSLGEEPVTGQVTPN